MVNAVGRLLAPHVCGGMQIIIIYGTYNFLTVPVERHQQSGTEKRKRKKMKPVHKKNVFCLFVCLYFANILNTTDVVVVVFFML